MDKQFSVLILQFQTREQHRQYGYSDINMLVATTMDNLKIKLGAYLLENQHMTDYYLDADEFNDTKDRTLKAIFDDHDTYYSPELDSFYVCHGITEEIVDFPVVGINTINEFPTMPPSPCLSLDDFYKFRDRVDNATSLDALASIRVDLSPFEWTAAFPGTQEGRLILNLLDNFSKKAKKLGYWELPPAEEDEFTEENIKKWEQGVL